MKYYYIYTRMTANFKKYTSSLIKIIKSVCYFSYLNSLCQFNLSILMDISKLRFVKQLFINGRFVNSIKNQTFDVIDPNNETVLTSIQRGSP